MMTMTKCNSLRTFFVLCHILTLVFCIALLIVLTLWTIGANAILDHMPITNNSIWWTGTYALFLSAISIGRQIYSQNKNKTENRKK